MPVELRIPTVGESVTEVQVGGWLVQPGDHVERDQALVVIETDKATVELPSPVAGTLAEVRKKAGARVKTGEVIGTIEESAGAEQRHRDSPKEAPRPPPSSPPPPAPKEPMKVMPAAARALADRGLRADQVAPSGPGGRLLKEDVERAAPGRPAPAASSRPQSAAKPPPVPTRAPPPKAPAPSGGRSTEAVPMSPIRRTIARRLVEAKQAAALLTTFNEIDMGAVMELRRLHGAAFQEKHGVKLGFMSFFVKAAVDALAAVPAVNAQIRPASGSGEPGVDEILYHHYCDVGVAIGGGKGLVVPVIRDAERLTFAQIEQTIGDFAQRAAGNRLSVEELSGGTFTISNGGIYGSLMSTPIVNPPQSGVLGMHAIQERPVARDGQVVIRPMMYVALTYDHRLVDGREAVTFLKRVKECVESPARLLLEI
jgi:2-oxoglutarate dehydrogenase E2 component (dihydrolipoamide succinyltransferase)